MPLSVNQKIHSNAIKASVNLARYEAAAKAKVVQQLERLRKDIVAEMMDKALKKTAFTEARLNQLLTVTDKVIKDSYTNIAATQQVELYDLMKVQTGISQKLVNDAIGFSLLDTSFSDTQLERLASNVLIQGAPSAEWWARAGKGTTEKFADNMRQGMLGGETIDQLVARVQDSGGVMFKSTRQAEALVRTSVQTAANDIRQEVIKQNQDLFAGIQWVATLDSRTTEICMALDGLIWDNDLEPVDHDRPFPGPTAHWGCRSTQVPVLKKWEDLLENKDIAEQLDAFEKENPGTRASVDGQVSAKMNYEEWLKTRPEAEQIEILGPAKWQLWKDDKLFWTEMVDQTGRPLTLKELAMQYNLEGSIGAASVSSLVKAADAVADAKAATDSAISTAISSAVTTEKATGTTAYVKQLLKEGKDTQTILAMVKEKYPNANTSAGMVSTVKSKLKAEMSKGVVAQVEAAKVVAAKEVEAVVAKVAKDVLAVEEAALAKLAKEKDVLVAASKVTAKEQAAQAKTLYEGGNLYSAQVAAAAWAESANYLYLAAVEKGLDNVALMKSFADNAKAYQKKVDDAIKAKSAANVAKGEAHITAEEHLKKSKTQFTSAEDAMQDGDHGEAMALADNSLIDANKALKYAKISGDDDLIGKAQWQVNMVEQNISILNKMIEEGFEDIGDDSVVVKKVFKTVNISEYAKKDMDILLIKAQDQLSQGLFNSSVLFAEEVEKKLLKVIKQITDGGGDPSYYEGQVLAAKDVMKYAAMKQKIDLHDVMTPVTTAVKAVPVIEVSGPTSYMKALLLQGKTPAEIVKLVKEKYPDANPSTSMVSVVKSKMKKMGVWDAAPLTAPITSEQAAKLAVNEAVQYAKSSGAFANIVGDRAVKLMKDFLAAFGSSAATGTARLLEAEKSALRSYTASSTNMNYELRKGTTRSNASLNAERGLWRNGLEENTLLYRGVRSDFAATYIDMAKRRGLAALKDISINDPAFMSTSITARVANAWGGNDGLLFEIRAPKGTPGAYVKPISHFPSENEWLLPPGGRFHIIGAEWIEGAYGGKKLKLIVELYFPKGKPK